MKIVLVGSTYRCGTQWLTWLINEYYSDVAISLHEPLGQSYLWRKKSDRAVQNHFLAIREFEQTYIETGWSSFKVIPWFQEEFDNLRLIHLVRHPVDVAMSAKRVGLDTFEKALERWMEVNEELLSLPTHGLWKVESLWRYGSVLRDFLGAFNLPPNTEAIQARYTVHDKWNEKPKLGSKDVYMIRAHQNKELVTLAKRFGYVV